MNLKKQLNVNIYWLVATYKVKQKNAPMLAVLKAVREIGATTAYDLQDHLLSPLSVQACSNLLARLKDLQYLEDWDEEYIQDWEEEDIQDWDEEDQEYTLTKLGEMAVAQEVFYEERKGVLKIWTTSKNDFVQQEIIKIQELGKDAKDYQNEDAAMEKIPSSLKRRLSSEDILVLNNGQYIIDKIEDKGIIGKPAHEKLTLNLDDRGLTAKVLDYEERQPSWTAAQAAQAILIHCYKERYIRERHLVKVPFDARNLALHRKETIEAPKLGDTTFEPIHLSLKLSPIDTTAAIKWYFARLKEHILSQPNYVSEEAFKQDANELAEQFVLFEPQLSNQFPRALVLKYLNKRADFYIRAKLETINYLTY
ncbi:MAG: hypothetical protein AB8E82_04860 [Aureispira sp.]